jgi:branched-chain amino acid transport system permease protein
VTAQQLDDIETTPAKRRHRYDVLFAFIALIVGLSWVGDDPYKHSLALHFMTLAIIALAMYVPFVMGGVVSVAYGAYVAIGAYAVALVSTRSDWPLIVAFPIGMAVAAAVAAVLAFATSRLSGFYLAAITLIFAHAFQAWLTDNDSLTGGEAGLSAFRHFTIVGITLTRDQIVWLCIGAVFLIALLLSNLRKSSFGIAMRARREVPIAIEAAGVRVFLVTAAAQLLGATLAAVGGSLHAVQSGAVIPEAFPVALVITALFAPLLGGVESPWGVLVGCVLVVEFTYNLDWIQETGSLFFALAIILVLLIAPRGILGYRPRFPRLPAMFSRVSGHARTASSEVGR